MLMVVCNPDVQCPHEGSRTRPRRQPEAFFCERAQHPLGVRMALGVVIAGEGWPDPQAVAGLHEGLRRWLTPVVTHQGHPVVSNPLGDLATDRQVQGGQPMPGRAGWASVVADDLFGIPIHYHHDLAPPAALSQELGHVDAPPRMGRCRPGFASRWRTCRPERPLGLHHQVRRSPQAQHPLLVDGLRRDQAQVGPDAAIAPNRGLGFEFLKPSEPAFMTLGDQGRRGSAQPSPASLLLNSRVSSPTRALNRAFSRAKRASLRAS